MSEQIERSEKISEDVSYDEMSWQKLKPLMTAEGQDWVDRDHAIAYLKNVDGDEVSSAEEDATGTEEDATGTEEDAVADDEKHDIIDPPADVENKDPVFDPDEKHGVISGDTNARYWQNGCNFDSQGNYIPDSEAE